MTTNEDTFFDIHMHAFNLSHPYFYSFLKRYKLNLSWFLVIGIISLFAYVFSRIPPLGDLFRRTLNQKQNTLKNMLSVWENDIGSFFLTTEDCLREKENPLLQNNELVIRTRKYQRVVMTPLMMDFGYKGKKEDSTFHYSRPSEKPIVEQVVDVFNAIKKYKKSVATLPDDKLCQKYPSLVPGTKRVIEIYPFLGINTRNYELKEIKDMLKKYFQNYKGSREDLFQNLGQFDGDIENIPSNFFAGVKVYPPLGFNPWPSDKDEQDKVAELYRTCVEQRIPITAHGGAGGFVTIENKRDLAEYTSMSRWETVLEHYPTLKLNLAHFPAEFAAKRFFARPAYKQENQRLKAIITIILDKRYENVYTDFSCRAWNDKYYSSLRMVLDGLSAEDRIKLTSRILFGSDYAVNLGGIESYNKYLDSFARTECLTPEEKHAFCCLNPQRFLFT